MACLRRPSRNRTRVRFMGVPRSSTGHVDTFAADHLPDPSAQPELLWDHPSLRYPDRLNCGAELLDAMVAAGHGSNRCLRDATGREWTYAEVLGWANRIANVLTERARGLVPGNRVLLAGTEQSVARGVLAGGAKGWSGGRGNDAAAARRRVAHGDRQGSGRPGPVRLPVPRRAGRRCSRRVADHDVRGQQRA